MFFEGKVNGELELYDLIDNYRHDYKVCLLFMRAKAAAYYLGSYLIWSLDDDIYGPEITGILLDRFDSDKADKPDLHQWSIEIVENLSPEQKRAVHNYCRFFQTEYADHYPFNDFDKIYLMLGG